MSDQHSLDPILIVDDNPTNLQVLMQTLEELEYPILLANSGEEALETVENQTPALVLLDIMMPGIDGYETLETIRLNSKLDDVPVIFLSALDDLDYKVKGLSLGAVDYITKPFQIGEVLARVDTHLTISNLKKELAERNRQLASTNEYILEAVAEGIYGLDENGNITFANPAACQLTGYTNDELLGQSIFDLHFFAHWDGTPYNREQNPIYKTLKDCNPSSNDRDVMWRKSGDHFAVEYSCSACVTADAKKTGLSKTGLNGAVMAFQDITQRKRQENTLRQALSEVELLKEKLQAENTYLQDQIRTEGHFQDIVGQSVPLLELLEKVKQVASTNSTVLIQGESGTGKEAIARAIHDNSARSSRPLIKINCGAISPNLIESELFGHEKGAFTGALKQRTGYFELADGGTIFLDEVGELPAEAQVKLLRVLQEQEFSRVGSEETIRVDVRVTAATNKQLQSMVEQGLFRMDLFYRLNVFPLQIPPLRERREDIPLLANYFLKEQETELGKTLSSITPDSMQLLLEYHWPGNIRELQNVIERSAILNQGDQLVINQTLISSETAINSQAGESRPGDTGDSGIDADAASGDNFDNTRLIDIEKQHIIKVLEMTSWTIAGKGGAADKLDLPASTLRSKMKKLGIIRPK